MDWENAMNGEDRLKNVKTPYFQTVHMKWLKSTFPNNHWSEPRVHCHELSVSPSA